MRSAVVGVLLLVGLAQGVSAQGAGGVLAPPSVVAGVSRPATQGGAQQRTDKPYVVGQGSGPSGQPQPMPSPVVEFDLVQEVQDRISPFSPAEVRRLRSELEERERAWYENLAKKPQPKAVVSE